MKIEYETKDVRITRSRTVAEALAPICSPQYSDVVSGLMWGTFHKDTFAHVGILRESLAREYEGVRTYRRVCALASLDAEVGVREFCEELDRKGYYPASLSEGSAYLALLLASGVKVGAVLHLGTFILDEAYREQRLLTREHGRAELVTLYPATKLKSYYRIVVVKKGKPYGKE